MKRSLAHYSIFFPNGSVLAHIVLVHSDGVDTDSNEFLKELTDQLMKSEMICDDSSIVQGGLNTTLNAIQDFKDELEVWSFNNGGCFRLQEITPLSDEQYDFLTVTLGKMNTLKLNC